MRILFIGNSHTYYNDMPYLFAELARAAGQDVDVTMLTRGGESLSGHIRNEHTRFNLLYGRYDLAVLQEVTSEFPEIKEYFDGVRTLKAWADQGGARCGLYMNFESPSDTPPLSKMRPAVLEAGDAFDLPVTRVGEAFARARIALPGAELYGPDRHHASPEGSYLAALTLLHDLLNVRVRGLPAQVSFGGQTLVSLSAEMAEAMQRLVQAL